MNAITKENKGCVEDTQKDKYLTFHLAEENYSIEVDHVVEIIGIQKITHLPDMPPYIRGVINLRGQVIPVMDMRLRFHLPARDYDGRTCMVVVRVGEQTVGLVVDRINEVSEIPESQIESPASGSMGHIEQNVKGIGKVGQEIRILLEPKQLLED